MHIDENAFTRSAIESEACGLSLAKPRGNVLLQVDIALR